VSHEEEVLGRAYDGRLMRRMLGYLTPYRWQVALAVLVVLVDALVGLAGPWLTKEAIDHGIRHRDLGYLDLVAGLYLGVLVLGFGLGYLQHQVMQRVGQNIMLDLRLSLFRHLQRLPMRYYDRHPVGRIMTRVTNDVDVLNEMFTSGVVAIFGDIFALVGIVIAMWRLNAELLAVTFSVLPLVVIMTLLFRSRVRRSFRDIRTRLARMNAFLNENLTGMNTVQILNREQRNFEEFRRINGEHRDANLQAVFYNALFFPVLELIGAIAVSLIVWYGGRQVMWTGITLGTLVAFIQYTQRFFRPISDLSEKYNILQQALASSERIFGLLDTPADPAAGLIEVAEPSHNGRPTTSLPSSEATHRRSATPLSGRVEFDRVSFAYQDDTYVLRDVTFSIDPGEKVALVGATGSGKTTLTSLLLRYYEPQSGEIRVDNRPLRDWPIEVLRQRVGLVLQDVFLFSGTVESNLSLGDQTLSREALERAAREVHAHEFIDRLPGGYEAQVMERGATLSSGQKQLLAFARALARDPDLLILDEATSSVDTHTELLIQDALRRLMRNRTSLVIAHRLSTIQDVDRIVVLHHGRVREIGTHAELLALDGIYTRLYRLQYLGDRSLRASGDGRR
jgi:ATP-binding cassette subfamily B protein